MRISLPNNKRLLLLVVASFSIIVSQAQLTGGNTYPINGTQNPPTSFGTVANAFTYINANGTTGSGTIILEIQSGYAGESGAIPALTAYSGMDASRPIVLRPGSGQTPTISTAPGASTGVIHFTGASFFTIDGSNNGTNSRDLTIRTTATATTNTVVSLVPTSSSSCQGITVKSCVLVGYSTTTAVSSQSGIYLGGATVPSAAARGGNNNNYFYNNYIQAVRSGIYLRGTNVSTTLDSNNIVKSNLIGGTIGTGGTSPTTFFGGVSTIDLANGILVNSQNYCLIDSNVIRNNVQANYYAIGINVACFAATGLNTNVTVSNNRISDIIYSGTGGYGVNGMRIGSGTSTANNINVFNNFIWNIACDADATTTFNYNLFGIALFSNATTNNTNVGINLYHNSINLYDNGAQKLLTRTNLVAACIGIQTYVAGGVKIVNNILRNTYPGNGTNVANSKVMAIHVQNASLNPMSLTSGGRINHNDYYVAGPSSVTGMVGMTGTTSGSGYRTSFANWVAFTGNDSNSLNCNPDYFANSDLRTLKDSLDGAGNYVGISTDILGNARNTSNPDIGGFEYTLANMTYDSTSAEQISGNLAVGTQNAQILRIKVSATGSLSPLQINRLSFRTTGSTNPSTDIDSAKVFFTGLSNTFSTANRFGTVVSPNGVFHINGNQSLTPLGDNYFWLVYTIKNGATANNVVDAIYDSILVGGNRYLPAVGNPTGNRTILGAMNGNYNVGAGQTYTTIGAAIADISIRGLNAPVTFTLVDTVYNTSTGETFPIVVGAIPNTNTTNTVTLQPASGITCRIWGAANGDGLIRLNGTNYFLINGRQGGNGTPKSLTVLNTSTSGYTAYLINDASNNVLKNTIFRGVNTTATSGVIYFGTGIATGNDNNLVDSCDIADYTTTPATSVYSAGSTDILAKYNDNNTVSNCNIYNFWNSSAEANAFKISNGTNTMALIGNSVYQTAPRTGTSLFYAFNFQNSGNLNALNGCNVRNNYIGGSEPMCGGTAWVTANTFAGGYLNLGTTTLSRFSNNTYANMILNTTSTGNAWYALSYINGVMSIDSNVIGSLTDTSSIIINSTGNSTSSFIGISVSPNTTTPTGTYSISGNKIGGIKTTGSTASISSSIIGINITSATSIHTLNFDNNIIGNEQPENIHASNASVSTTAQNIIGFQNTSSANLNFRNNIIRNFRNNTYGSGTTSTFAHGINSNAGVNTITGNQIYNFSNNAYSQNNNTGSAAIIGIQLIPSTSGNTVSQNTIYNLALTNTGTATVTAHGMNMNNMSNTNVARNSVHTITSAASGTTSSINGIQFGGLSVRMFNNMIRLGFDSSGTPMTTTPVIAGINKVSGNLAAYHNSVYIGGSSVSTGTSKSYAFNKTVSGTDTLMNNIFVNERSNSSTGGTHYAIAANNNTTFTANYNLYNVSGNGTSLGEYNATAYSTMSDWKNASGVDGNSNIGIPNFINPSGSASSGNLHISSSGSTPIEGSGVAIAGIVDDYDGQTRSGLTPTDIGADAGNFTPTDIFPPAISYSLIPRDTISSQLVLNSFGVITDVSGVARGTTNGPRMYYKKSTHNNAFNGNTSSDNGWKYVTTGSTSSPFSFTINYGILLGGSSALVIPYSILWWRRTRPLLQTLAQIQVQVSVQTV